MAKAALREAPFYLLVMVLAAFQFGWVFWPLLGTYWTIINASAFALILLAALIVKICM